MSEETRVLNSEVALLAIKLAYQKLRSKLAEAEGVGTWGELVWGPEKAVTIVISHDWLWQCVHAPKGLRRWFGSEAGQEWLEGEGLPMDSGPEVFARIAWDKLARLNEAGTRTSGEAVIEGAAFLKVGDCLYPGAVRYQGFDVSTSALTGQQDEEFSDWVGDYILTICKQIAEALCAMEHRGTITQEMLDKARAEVLARWRQLLPRDPQNAE